MSIERLEGGLQAGRQLEGIEVLGFSPPFAGHVCQLVLPQIAVNGHFAAGNVLGPMSLQFQGFSGLLEFLSGSGRQFGPPTADNAEFGHLFERVYTGIRDFRLIKSKH